RKGGQGWSLTGASCLPNPPSDMNRTDNSVGAAPCASPLDGDKRVPLRLISDIAARDYTGGKGVGFMEKLLLTAATVATSVSEALEVIKRHLDTHIAAFSRHMEDEQ